MAKGKPGERRRQSDLGVSIFFFGGRIAQSLIETIGLPGTFLVLAYSFVVRYASLEQKRAIIDEYILWRGTQHVGTIAVFLVVVFSIMMGQRHYYDRKLRQCRDEIKRVGEEKSALQAKLSPQPTHHSKS
jgi:hypothetical protein